MYYKLDFKLFVLWMLLLIQVLLVIFYLLMAPSSFEFSTTAPELSVTSNSLYPVKFVVPKSKVEVSQKDNELKYLTSQQSIVLNSGNSEYFLTINGTICFASGTDVGYMKRIQDRYASGVKCECKQGWHGRDCGQPEVIWRAFIASRQKIFLKRRKQPRRIIHAFYIANLEIILAEIILEELSNSVDLFIICESNYTETGEPKSQYLVKKLQKGFFKGIQHKILYIPYNTFDNSENTHLQNMRRYLWQKGRSIIKNLQPDDMLVMTDAYAIPNTKALLFFKLYDGWPQPIGFRLMWSVYGFYWQHPKKTITAPGAWTAQLVEEVYHNDLSKIHNDPVTDNEDVSTYRIVVGDLNHYGGWYCNWCLDPKDIVLTLQQIPNYYSPVKWDRIENRKIDSGYIEDLIGTGLWLDSKTELLHKSQYRDTYFAPKFVLNNTWKYDFLLTNFYSKLDYN